LFPSGNFRLHQAGNANALVLLFGMLPGSLGILSRLGAEPPVMLVVRMSVCLAGLICLFASFRTER